LKLLVDENLSHKFVARLSSLFPGSAHLSQVGLLTRPWHETAIGAAINHTLFGDLAAIII